MSKFQVVKTIPLSFLGEGWGECEVKMSAISVKEARDMASMDISVDSNQDEQVKAAELMMDIIKKKFISGTGYDGEKVIPMEAEDIEDLPPQAMNKVLVELTSGVDPNA